PYKLPSECMSYIRYVASKKDDALLVYGDDGEKFGEWPGTYKWVFEEKWLENFFNELERNSDWLSTAKLSDCLDLRKSEGRIYLPTSSYEEMLEWSLPADTQEYMQNVVNEIRGMGKEDYYKPFIRGGFWRNFFTKYPESNHMNKKMVHVSVKLENLRRENPEAANSPVFREAETELLRGQCNCAYWHGVFGGLYLYHLRNAIYEHLIRAEALEDQVRHGKKNFCDAYETDMDAEGNKDFVLENRGISVIVSPSKGGTIKEIDSKTMCQNYVNTLSRKKEAYHRTILEKIKNQTASSGGVRTIHDGIQTADAALKDNMSYDKYPRHCFLDHYLPVSIDAASFAASRYEDLSSFPMGIFSVKQRKDVNGVSLLMSKEGDISGKKALVEKNITLLKKGCCIRADYVFQNKSKSPLDFIFAVEFNFTMRYADSPRYQLFTGEKKTFSLSESLDSPCKEKVSICDLDTEEAVTISFKTSCNVWSFPVKTVSQSEKAYELNYQGTSLVPRWRVSLKPGEKQEIFMEVSLGA
nr:DUF1926 domain-containing protein [Candidatus Omnitrophota bacterium]